ncbi:MAG: polysaccharide biosynthesis/export family protein [Acidobacteriota bacterium]|nr:polysaccharide biosynthesis/export family protein [Acidobacteriota bacterium]
MKGSALTIVTVAITCLGFGPFVVAEPGQEAEPRQTGLSGEYRIGPRDVLRIDVFRHDELDREVRVLRDGTISIPLLVTFRIADLTPQEAAAEIARMLAERDLINDPQVSVFVEEFISSSVSLQGAIQSPGIYPLIGQGTLLEMISAAGGLRRDDVGREILVLRGGKNDQQQRLAINIDVLSEGDVASNIVLEPGDILIVQQARTQRVYVTGAVRNPGAVEFSESEGITVLQAVSAAGGPTERANRSKVHIVRRRADGGHDRINLDLKKIRKGKAADIMLDKNDTIVVGEWFF